MTTSAPAQAGRHAAAHAQRMNKVLDHIDRHLGETLELADLATVAHFSPYHFHRVFAAWMGETLGDYLRRRRLDSAALRLARNPGLSVLEVALAVGFGSGEAFARAFRQRFGCTPSAWRADAPQRWVDELAPLRRRDANRKRDQAHRNPDQAGAGAHGDDGGSTDPEFPMDVTLETLPATRIAYLRHIGPYGSAVSEFWRQVFMPWMQASGLHGRSLYGIGRDDPLVTDPSKCRYDAAVEVPVDYVPRAPAVIGTLPGGRYAVAPFRGTLADLEAAYGALLGGWLPGSGMQTDGRPIFEHYPADAWHDAETGAFECRLCVPVVPARV